MDKIKTRNVERSLYVNYLKRASECLDSAKQSFDLNRWNASAISAIHSAIATVDALCVYFLGQRHAGQSHGDAINLFRGIKKLPQKSIDNITKRMLRILKMKNMAEYEERLVYQSEAEKILKDADRLFEDIKNILPK